LAINDACLTVWKAFEKSNEKTCIVRTVWSSATIAAVVEPDGLNANWSLKSSVGHDWSSAGTEDGRRVAQACATGLRTGVIEIGRKSLACVGVAVSGIGDMIAVFHWRGTTPVANDWLNRRVSGPARRRNHAGIWSSPVAVGRSVSSIRNTVISVIRHRSSKAVSFGLGRGFHCRSRWPHSGLNTSVVCTHVPGIYKHKYYTVTFKSRLMVTQGH